MSSGDIADRPTMNHFPLTKTHEMLYKIAQQCFSKKHKDVLEKKTRKFPLAGSVTTKGV